MGGAICKANDRKRNEEKKEKLDMMVVRKLSIEIIH